MNYGQIVIKGVGVKGVDLSGSKEVFGLNIYRHAGDFRNGNKDSWFVEVQVKIQVIDSDYVELTPATLKMSRNHGLSMDKVRNLSARILLEGSIDSKLWDFNNVHTD